MAEVSVTAGNVVPASDAIYDRGTAGGTITAGMPVYKDLTTGLLRQADANASLETAEVVGIALQSASLGQSLRYQRAGTITIGGTVVLSTIYILGAAGGIAPAADLASGWYCTILGVAISATQLRLCVFPSRALKA